MNIISNIRSIDGAFKRFENPVNSPEARDIVTLISSINQVRANIKVIQAEDEMKEHLLNIKA